jgi:hypothetical protein
VTRYSSPLLIAATMCFMTLPAPALAHGLSSRAATFILSFLALALAVPTLTDFFAIKRWLFKDRAWLPAILTHLTATAVAIPLFLALQWLSSAAATVLESGQVRAAYWLRTLSPWPEGLVTIAAMAVTKGGILAGELRSDALDSFGSSTALMESVFALRTTMSSFAPNRVTIGAAIAA